MGGKKTSNESHDPKDVCHKGCFGICRREFAQQTLKYNQFYVKPMCFSLVYAVIGVAVLAMSMVFKADLLNVHAVGPVFYKENDCSINGTGTCVTDIEIHWDGPTDGKDVMLYYWLEGFMQIHRSFTMNGYFKNGQYVFRPVQNDSYFNDSYVLLKDDEEVDIDETKIAFPADIDFLLPPGDHGLGGKWNGQGNRMGWYVGSGKTGVYNYGFCTKYKNCESTTERELVWRKSAPGLNLDTKWPKLYGRIRGGFQQKGKYTLRVSNFYPVDYFGGKKGVYLSTMGAYGGKFGTTWLANLSLWFGILCIILSVTMCIIQALWGKSRNLSDFFDRLKTSRPETLAEIRVFKPTLSTFCNTGVNEARLKVEKARQNSDVSLAAMGNVTPK